MQCAELRKVQNCAKCKMMQCKNDAMQKWCNAKKVQNFTMCKFFHNANICTFLHFAYQFGTMHNFQIDQAHLWTDFQSCFWNHCNSSVSGGVLEPFYSNVLHFIHKRAIFHLMVIILLFLAVKPVAETALYLPMSVCPTQKAMSEPRDLRPLRHMIRVIRRHALAKKI